MIEEQPEYHPTAVGGSFKLSLHKGGHEILVLPFSSRDARGEMTKPKGRAASVVGRT
jgi:hypothetical protein